MLYRNVRFAPPKRPVGTACKPCARTRLTPVCATGAPPSSLDLPRLPPLAAPGPLRVRDGGRILDCADGTSRFFWLGDTWWMGFCTRIAWLVTRIQQLTADRVAKGFSLVQIVAAGLYPDMLRSTTRENGSRFESPWRRGDSQGSIPRTSI